MPRTSNTSNPAVLLVLGSCISLQFGAALAAQLFPTLGAWGTTTLRLGIAALVLLAIARPAVRAWKWDQWRATFALGLALAGMNGFFYAAIERIPLGTAVAIEFLGPLALAALLTRTGRDLVWVGLALLGMAVLGLESLLSTTGLDPLGVGFALIAAVFWALYIQTGARVGILVPGTGGLAIALAVATLAVSPLGLSGATAVTEAPHLLLIALGTALLASVIPYTLELAAMRRVPRNVFGILLSLEPVAATAIGWLLLHQHAGPLRLAAVVLVVAASVGSSLSAGRAAREEEPVSSPEPVRG
ncbi:EamA family transporter [Kineosporia rhizophila]|uniref:EamA family transporter n=1 Tax=Kineosporia TaxID=49184 RepID=UPI001E54AEB8|nr:MULTISPECIES: EamA family transporter [Kineosporia]MCE0539695.1 EamA family transporter [Kineosporia rhizophila]GLY16411.1 DMT transporter permease [Kineosporia sp. NBRC 101677]